MKEKDKWIKNFRTRMEGYSEPAPADLWEQLEKELDTVPKVIPMWRRWQAVAAVALLVVVSSLTVWFWQSPSANYLEKQSAELNVMHEPDELAPGSITPEQPMALVVPAARSGKKQHVKVGGVAKAGGAVEKCVSGKRSIIGSVSTSNAGKDEQFSGGEENVKVKPLQWSLSAAAGAQFKITEKLGIYAEPGVVYYFDDGSNVNTIRKEHPFNFNIQLGVRFTLPK
jgi:hypothetical protein